MIDKSIIQQLDEDLRNNKYPPAILCRVLFLNFFRAHFYLKEPGKFKYDPDDKISEIKIEDSWTTEDAVRQKLPAIILSRSPIMAMNTSLYNNLNQYFFNTGTESHIDLLTTNMEFQCISTNMIESEIIASQVFNIIRYYKDDIRQRGLHQIVQPVINVPNATPSIQSTEKIASTTTTVTCQIYMVDGWVKRKLTDKDIEYIKQTTGVDLRSINNPPNELADFELTFR